MKFAHALLFAALAAALLPGSGPPNQQDPYRGSTACEAVWQYGRDDENWEACDAPWFRDDCKFVPFDVYYNGTTTISYVSLNDSHCPPLEWPRPVSLVLGGMNLPNDTKVTRKSWDDNDFFLALRDMYQPICTSWSIDNGGDWPVMGTNSSTSFYYWSQAWTLTSTKAGDGFDIQGNLTTTKSIPGNGIVIYFPESCTSIGARGINSIAKPNMLAADEVYMSGHVSPMEADVVFHVNNLKYTDPTTGYNDTLPFQITISFSGQWWQDGAKLLTSGDFPAADGTSSEGYQVPTTSSPKKRPFEIIVPSVLGGLVVVHFCYFCCCRKRRKRTTEYPSLSTSFTQTEQRAGRFPPFPSPSFSSPRTVLEPPPAYAPPTPSKVAIKNQEP